MGMKNEAHMNEKPMVYFDLDGTLYDLYAQPMWLERITTLADPTVYDVAEAIMYANLDTMLNALVAAGYGVGVVTWLAKDASNDYNAAVRTVKRAWVARFMPQATEVHVVKYGTPKHNIIKCKGNAIMVDDNAHVRNTWTHGMTVEASVNIEPILMALVG